MAAFYNICGPVVADTVYSDGALVARDTSVTLPEVTPMTADLSAMGTFTMPIWQRLENMELSITKIGVDQGLKALIKPEPLALEVRWLQTVTDAGGFTKEVGCKAFLRGIPTKIPGIGLTPGEAGELECTFSLTRYQLIADGAELLLVDRLAGIVRIGGKDYAGGLGSFL